MKKKENNIQNKKRIPNQQLNHDDRYNARQREYKTIQDKENTRVCKTKDKTIQDHTRTLGKDEALEGIFVKKDDYRKKSIQD